MKKIAALLFGVLASAWLLCAAYAGSPMLLGAGGPSAVVSSYSGPGDAVSGASLWGSCARAYRASYANGTNPLCDVVVTGTGVAACTIRVTTSGFADLAGSYCAGSTTLASACGAGCRVTKIYDQIGTNHWVQATLGSMPDLTLAAINGLPGITCVSSRSSVMSTGVGITQAQPFSWSVTFKNTSIAGISGNFVGTLGVSIIVGADLAPNSFYMNAGTPLSNAATDSSFHAAQAVFNGGSSVLNVDNVDASGAGGANAYSNNQPRFCRGNATGNADGVVMEAGIWSSAISGGNRTLLNTNQHGLNGYNF